MHRALGLPKNLGEVTVASKSSGLARALVAAALMSITWAPSALAAGDTRTHVGEVYAPTIWVDPDGCEHWVMDDGWEGFMTPHVTRDGIPVCNRPASSCGVLKSDVLFNSGSYTISHKGRAYLLEFFRQNGARAYVITGHTDSRASDAFNLQLSYKRAHAVAQVAKSAGINVTGIRGYGERAPIATNSTAWGMQKNRRVEIQCIR